LVASASLAVEVCALADKYEVAPLARAAADVARKELKPETACETLALATKLGATEIVDRALILIRSNAKSALPLAFLLDPDMLCKVLSCPQLCIADFELAQILLAWHTNDAAKHHDVQKLLERHVLLASVTDEEYNKLEVLARDFGLNEKVKALRRGAKRGKQTRDVFGTLFDQYTSDKTRGADVLHCFIGYYLNIIPSRKDIFKGSASVYLENFQRSAAGHREIELSANDSVMWFMPHHTLFIHGISFYTGICGNSIGGSPEVSVSMQGSEWTTLYDAKDDGALSTSANARETTVRPCHCKQGVQWFRLRTRKDGFSACVRFHGILVTG